MKLTGRILSVDMT